MDITITKLNTETNLNLEKLSSLEQELKVLRLYLEDKGISCRNSSDYKRIKTAICRVKKKIDPALHHLSEYSKIPTVYPVQKVQKKKGIKPEKVQKEKGIKPETNSPKGPRKKPILSNLNFITQWELAPVLTAEKANAFIPSQVEDLHAFILENYFLSSEDTESIPVQILAIQFLMYLVERENSNVRITHLKGQVFIDLSNGQNPNIKPPESLKDQVINSLTDMNAWKNIIQIVNKTFGPNNDLRDIKSDASLGDKYFAPISNSTNPLSLDGLGNFLELFKARIEWVSKSSCCKLKIDTLQVQNTQGTVDQISTVNNLRLRESSWLKNHRYLLDWSLPFQPDENFKGIVKYSDVCDV